MMYDSKVTTDKGPRANVSPVVYPRTHTASLHDSKTGNPIHTTRIKDSHECDELGMIEASIIGLIEASRSIVHDASPTHDRRSSNTAHRNSERRDGKNIKSDSPKHQNLRRVFERQCNQIQSDLSKFAHFIRQSKTQEEQTLRDELSTESELETYLSHLRSELGMLNNRSLITPSPLLSIDDDIADILSVRDRLLSQIEDYDYSIN